MKFDNSMHMFYYLRKVFVTNDVEIPQSQEWLKEKCDLVFHFYNSLTSKNYLQKGFKVSNFKNKFSYGIYSMVVENYDSDEIENFANYFVEQLYLFVKDLVNNDESPELDYGFIQDNFIEKITLSRPYQKAFSKDFEEDFLNYSVNTNGIYFLFSEDDRLLYVGKSGNLFTRMEQSIKDRGATKYQYILTKSKAEMHLYEIYYILKLKPDLNIDCIDSDDLEIELPKLEMSDVKRVYKE